LWAEADRMSGLAVNQDNLKNQQGVVGNEVKVNVLNAPYGGFPWLDMPQYANTNWYNAHNFYGDLKDIDAATLADVQAFFKTYYAPNNAALAIVGDFDPADARRWVEKYFGPIKPSELPAQPVLTEPRQEREKRVSRVDPLAKRPAIALAYHMPDRNSPEYFAMGLIDQILIQGADSLAFQELVQKQGLTAELNGGINYLGNMFNYKGPMLIMADLRFDPTTSPDTIVKAWDTALEPLRSKAVDKAVLDRARVKLRSDFYDYVGQLGGFGLADMLASFALFDDNPARINTLISEFDKVTPELILKTGQEYLRPENRTVLVLETKSADAKAPAAPVKN
jgi:predicted Zn-dependent peptidase